MESFHLSADIHPIPPLNLLLILWKQPGEAGLVHRGHRPGAGLVYFGYSYLLAWARKCCKCCNLGGLAVRQDSSCQGVDRGQVISANEGPHSWAGHPPVSKPGHTVRPPTRSRQGQGPPHIHGPWAPSHHTPAAGQAEKMLPFVAPSGSPQSCNRY